VKVSAPAGCFWEVVSHSEWIKILSLNRGYGSGSIVFQVLPTKTDAPSTGFMRFTVHDLNRRQAATRNLPIKTTGLRAAQELPIAQRGRTDFHPNAPSF
jgi:hypothetical protein